MRHLSTSAFLKHTPLPSHFCRTSRTAQLKRHDWKIVYSNNLVENKMTLYTPVHLWHQSTHCAAALMSLEYRLHNDSFVTNPHVLSTKDYRNVIIQVSPLLSDSMQPAWKETTELLHIPLEQIRSALTPDASLKQATVYG